MQIGLIGLGRMGRALGAHAVEQGHAVFGFDQNPEAGAEAAAAGIAVAGSTGDLAARLTPPRIILLYVPHGSPAKDVCRALAGVLQRNDIVADGGNSHWDDSRRRHARFAASGIRFLDVGTSGGIEGARHGAAFMVGGDREAFEAVRPLLRSLAVDDGAVFAPARRGRAIL